MVNSNDRFGVSMHRLVLMAVLFIAFADAISLTKLHTLETDEINSDSLKSSEKSIIQA